MNKWVIVGLIVLVVLIGIGIAYDNGLFDSISIGVFSILFTVLAAPYLAVKNFLFGNKRMNELQEKYTQMKGQEVVHRTDMDKQIKAKEQRVAELNREIQLLDAKMEVLELKKKKVEQYVNSMSVDETKNEFRNLFGD